MAKSKVQNWGITDYEQAAEKYRRGLPLAHFREAIPQSAQREVTTESFALVRGQRGDVQFFSELLVQYFFEGNLKQVVPDNMVRISELAVLSKTTFAADMEPVGPLLVIEYVSAASYRKDYKESFRKYEQELKVPYCLMFYPDRQDLRIHRHTGEHYAPIPVNTHGRHPIPELELEVALLDGWVRFWFRGELLPLPAELHRQVEQQKRRANQAERQAKREKQRAEQEKQRAEQEKQRADDLDRQRAEAVAEAKQLRALLEQIQSRKGKS